MATALLCAAEARANSPLSIEQLMVERAVWQLVASYDYRSLQAGPWAARRQAGWGLALRYGAAENLEFNARLGRSEFRERAAGAALSQHYDSLGLGVNWRLRREGAAPAVHVELRGVVLDRSGETRRTLPRAELLVTGYKTIDPVVLSLSAAWEHGFAYREAGVLRRPGAAWRLEPLLNFAVNPQVTLVGGMSLERRRPTEIAGTPASLATERLVGRAGMAFAANERHSVFLLGDFAADAAGNALSLQWYYRF